MLVVGLTGGIGSGKSTVANLFAKHGIPVIDADLIARELTSPGEPAYKKILAHFGQALLSDDGTIDRAELRRIIFEQADERRWLEGLLHPMIRDHIEERISETVAPYCVVVIPLLVETGSYRFINRILVIDTPETLQIQRTTLRDKADPDQISAILNTQAKREDRLKAAQDVITNDGTPEQLAEAVNKLHAYYLNISLQ